MRSVGEAELRTRVGVAGLRARVGQARSRLAERNRVWQGAVAYRWAVMLAPWAVCAAAALVFANQASAFILLIGGTAIIYAMSAIGLTWVMGRAGLVSIGNAAIMAVGAYTTAILAPKSGWGVFPIPLVMAGVFGVLVGLLIGLPALRLRGVYLAFGTLALQFFVAFAGEQYQKHTGEVSGVPVPQLSIAGYDFTYGKSFVLLLFGFLFLTVLLVRNMFRQGPGRMWDSIRESELAASAAGVNIARWKFAAFIGSSALISMSGSLLAYYTRIVSFDTFSLDFAITFIVMIIIGGMGSIAGAIVGAALVTALPHLLTTLTNSLPDGGFGDWLSSNIYYVNNGLYGILVLFFLLYQPDGVVPGVRRLGKRVLNWVAPLERASPQAIGSVVKRPAVDLSEAQAGPELLRVDELEVTYRTGAKAVDGVSLRVDEGSIVVVLGRNGAGKTSTMRAISGFLPAEQVRLSGRVTIDGQDVLGLPPVKASARAVLVPERDKVFPSLTVREHLQIAQTGDAERVEDQPFFARLRERYDLPAGLLSGGERQLLALAVAWQLKPRVLMVDEFSLGLAPVMIRGVAEVIRTLRDEHRMTFLIVEQNAAAALDLADSIYVIESGRVVAHGTPQALADHDLLARIPTSVA